MKRQVIIARLSAVLMATFTITFLFAQDKNRVPAAGRKAPQTIAVAAFGLDPASRPASSTISVKAKVMRSFLNLFNDATEVNWSMANNRYFASFVQNGQLCKALFESSGALVFNLRYCTEKDLPRDVRRLFKSTYIDFTINAVTEMNTPDSKVWIANLTDHDDLIVASVHNGTLNELHHYKTRF